MNPVPCFRRRHVRQLIGRPGICRQRANIYDQNTEQEGEADEASPFWKQRMDIMQENCVKTLDVTKNER